MYILVCTFFNILHCVHASMCIFKYPGIFFFCVYMCAQHSAGSRRETPPASSGRIYSMPRLSQAICRPHVHIFLMLFLMSFCAHSRIYKAAGSRRETPPAFSGRIYTMPRLSRGYCQHHGAYFFQYFFVLCRLNILFIFLLSISFCAYCIYFQICFCALCRKY